MKKIFLSVFVVICLLTSVACATKVVAYDERNDISRLDKWKNMTGCFVEDGYVYAVGVGHYSTLKNARQAATLDAQVAIAQYVGAEIYAEIEEKADEADIEVGDMVDGTSMQWLTSMRKSGANLGKLSRVQVYDGVDEKSQDGKSYYYYILLGISEEDLNTQIAELVDKNMHFSSQDAADAVKKHFSK